AGTRWPARTGWTPTAGSRSWPRRGPGCGRGAGSAPTAATNRMIRRANGSRTRNPVHERELRLSAPGGFRTPAFGEPAGLIPVAQPATRFQTSYLDTPDLRLARWGCSLRHRSGEGWTVRLPADGKGPLLVRSEHVFDAGGEL